MRTSEISLFFIFKFQLWIEDIQFCLNWNSNYGIYYLDNFTTLGLMFSLVLWTSIYSFFRNFSFSVFLNLKINLYCLLFILFIIYINLYYTLEVILQFFFFFSFVIFLSFSTFLPLLLLHYGKVEISTGPGNNNYHQNVNSLISHKMAEVSWIEASTSILIPPYLIVKQLS